MAEKVTVRILAGAVKDHFIGCTRFSLSALRAAAADAPRSLTTCQYHIIQNEFSMRYY